MEGILNLQRTEGVTSNRSGGVSGFCLLHFGRSQVETCVGPGLFGMVLSNKKGCFRGANTLQQKSLSPKEQKILSRPELSDRSDEGRF